jgi:hypothetical protein
LPDTSELRRLLATGALDSINPGGEVLSDRGFAHWEPIIPRTGNGDGDTVRFYESSAAVALRGTVSDPVMIPGPFAWLGIGDTHAHLTYLEVEQLASYALRWLHLHKAEGTDNE